MLPLFVSTMADAQSAQFTPLDIPEPGYFSPAGVSADGNTVVGMAYIVGQGDKARRWRNGIGFDYPGPSSGPVANWASGVSADGSVVSGGTGHAVFGDLEGWMRYGASVGHVGSPPGHDTSNCLAVSGDGVISVGFGGLQSNPNLYQAAKYDDQGGWTNLGFLPGHGNSQARAVDADGGVIVGWSAGGFQSTTGFRWTAATGMTAIPRLPGGTEAHAEGTDASGAVVVGGDYAGPRKAWRWSAASGTQALAPLTANDECWANCIAPDAALVGGWTSANGGYGTACLWDAQGGVHELRALLAQRGLGAAIAGWSLYEVTCIAGSNPWYLVGDGVDSTGQYAAWLVRLDVLPGAEPGQAFCFGDDNGTPCPCSNPTWPGTGGCMNSLGLAGNLTVGGIASVANDSLVLAGTGMTSSTALYLQGSARENAGAGTLLGDGLLCVGGALVRLGSKLNVGGSSLYPLPGDAPISVRGSVLPGDVRSYQIWYRNAAAWCTNATFNLTNGYEVVWAP
ncbi:MAG: hypothetical protein HZA53_05715 [Planctomycetes bacterium]|nr:hypothetical protein [Planctomycetota bacterium]